MRFVYLNITDDKWSWFQERIYNSVNCFVIKLFPKHYFMGDAAWNESITKNWGFQRSYLNRKSLLISQCLVMIVEAIDEEFDNDNIDFQLKMIAYKIYVYVITI